MTPSRLRSLSPMPKKEIRHSVSVPHLSNKSSHAQLQSESEGMNTIPDPRSVTPQPPSRKDSSDSHPDLSQEVSTLSTKLINAINHSTMLDDSLQQTRIELEEAREQLQRLEARVMEHEDKISRGLLVDKIVYDKMEKQLTSEMHEERKRRIDAEFAKRKTDGEVEALTAALFEEANIMVASARKETEASEKRGEHLKQQLVDAEVLQNSLQEQLRDFKNAVEKMTANGEDNESGTLGTATEPSTPGITPSDKMAKLFEAVNLTPNTPGMDDINPDQPLVFSHLIRPILRSDLVAFNEFLDMLKISQRSAPSSRVSSANYGSLNVLGLGSLTNSSTSSLPGFGLGKSPDSAAGSPRDSNASNGLPNLKDDKFFKRALAEDIEPTLRLDIAPGLSWLARRTAINSITAGSLVVEPNPTHISKWRTPIFPCSLCGEQRKGDEYARKFRFKLSDTEEAQRYPLCDWCMGRVRATCDYIGFLRMVAAGHWRAETEDEQKSTWEESVRLRERMFWTRIGGGVVPSFVPMRDSPASPTFANGTSEQKDTMEREANRYDEEVFEPRDVSLSAGGPVQQPQAEKPSAVEQDPFQAKATETKTKRISIGKAIIMNPSDSTPTTTTNYHPVQTPTTIPEVPASSSSSVMSSSTATVLTSEEEKRIEEEAEAQLHNELRKSLDMRKIPTTAYLHHKRATSNPPLSQSVLGHKKNRDDRLSLMIPSGSMPGAFE